MKTVKLQKKSKKTKPCSKIKKKKDKILKKNVANSNLDVFEDMDDTSVPEHAEDSNVSTYPNYNKMKKSRENVGNNENNEEMNDTSVLEDAEGSNVSIDSNSKKRKKSRENVESNENIEEMSINDTSVSEHNDDSNVATCPNSKTKRGMKSEHRSEASKDISEFNLTEVGKEKVLLNELLRSSEESSNQTVVKKQLLNATKLKSLSVPLSKPQQEKIKRTIAYEKVCDDISKWDPIVNSNRSADQMVFPLKKPEIILGGFDTVSEKFISKHPVEIAVAEILQKSENVLDKTRTLTVAEEKALQAMSLEEAKLRHSELMKHRALISYQEAKARRQNKIKSKRYRRLLKKEKLKKVVKEFEELQKTDKQAALEKFLEADKLRILERVTLKHRNTGKWAKQQKIRAKYNPESRSNLKEDLAIGKQLREKICIDEPSLQSSRFQEVVDPEDKFFEDDETENCLIEEAVGDKPEDSLEVQKKTLMKEKIVEAILGENAKEKLTEAKETSKFASTKTLEDEIDFCSEATCLKSIAPDIVTYGDEDIDYKKEGKITIQEAFADEEFISEFQEEKKAIEEEKAPKGIDLFLPGWGTWGGPDVKEPIRKKKKFFIQPLEPVRPKNVLPNVIINEEESSKAAAHQVSQLPFPFNNVHQFNSYLRQPVSHTWNPQSSVLSLNAPKICTKMGKIIEPIDSEDVVLQKKQTETSLKFKKKKGKAPIQAF